MTLTKRLRVVTVLCGLLTLGFTSSSSAMISSTSNVHDWLFDTNGNSAVNTQSEAVTVAKRYDVVIAALSYKQYLPAMKTAHPGILIAPYHKGTSVQGSDFTWIKANHPTWLLHTSGGALLKSSWGTYLIDPRAKSCHCLTWVLVALVQVLVKHIAARPCACTSCSALTIASQLLVDG